MDFRHDVYQLSLRRGGGQFILELTGAQYGYYEPVIPFTQFMSNRVALEKKRPVVTAFGASQIWFEEQTRKTNEFVWPVNTAVSKCLLRQTKIWMERNNMTVKKLLKLDHGAYEASKKGILELVAADIHAFLKSTGEQLAALKVKRVKHLQWGSVVYDEDLKDQVLQAIRNYK